MKGWVVNAIPRLHYARGREPVFIIQKVERAPRPVWTGVRNKKYLTPTGILPPNLLPVARRYNAQALYHLDLLSYRQ
jgi:hypothetical protein